MAKTAAERHKVKPGSPLSDSPINRCGMEVKRQLDVLDRNSGEHRFLAGDDYTIAGITKGL